MALPGMLSWVIHLDTQAPVTGLTAFEPRDRPPVQIVFQAYHLMVAIGMALIGLCLLAALLLPGGRLFRMRPVLMLTVPAVLLPQLGNQVGWITAEVDQQPWIVYGLLRTLGAFSPVLDVSQVLWSLIMFGLIYALLFAVFVFLMHRKIKHGPDPEGDAGDGDGALVAGSHRA